MPFKRTDFFAQIAAATSGLLLSTGAQAVFLNPHGTGEALVFPYYTVTGGNSTVITLLNTTSEGKAVKVRFLEGYNGRDVLDLNLYLSPSDIWVGQVVQTAGGAGLFSNDNSCTVPKLPSPSASPLAFSTQNFDGTSAQGNDGGLIDVSRTQEGYVEVVEMGVVTNAAKGTLNAIEHKSGIPANCAQLVSAWGSAGYWQADPTLDLAPPDGGLSGAATIVDVLRGTVEGYVADALAQFYANGTASLHTAPGALAPTLASATSLTSLTYPGDAPVTASFARGIDAVSSVFMADKIMNEYWTSGGATANSEWVVSLPTKRFYTDPYYVNATAQPPFLDPFSAPGLACVPIYHSGFDREEQVTADAVFFTGIPPYPGVALCDAVQVLRFNQPGGQPSAVFGSTISAEGTTYAYEPNFNNGWESLDLYHGNPTSHLTSADGKIFFGLPATGFWVVQFVNGNINGALANFTALYPHRKHVTCATGTTPSAPACS